MLHMADILERLAEGRHTPLDRLSGGHQLLGSPAEHILAEGHLLGAAGFHWVLERACQIVDALWHHRPTRVS